MKPSTVTGLKLIFTSFVSVHRWWVREWQKCSASCGSSGLSKRTVLCVQAVSVEEQRALQPSDCEHIHKPESLTRCNTHIPCPANWTAGNWSKVSPGQFVDTCTDSVQKGINFIVIIMKKLLRSVYFLV